jgi:UDP-glucose 4-epimerase
MIQGRNVVYKVVDRKSGDAAQMAAERGAVLEQLKHKKAVATNELFMDSVRAKLEADGTVRVHPDAIKRLTASFRR